jgi:hypothetical protein
MDTGALSPGVKLTGHEADYSTASNAEVKNGGDRYLLKRLHGKYPINEAQ